MNEDIHHLQGNIYLKQQNEEEDFADEDFMSDLRMLKNNYN